MPDRVFLRQFFCSLPLLGLFGGGVCGGGDAILVLSDLVHAVHHAGGEEEAGRGGHPVDGGRGHDRGHQAQTDLEPFRL